eukprot:6189586-Pleurochrysis_carterae.AAC.1
MDQKYQCKNEDSLRMQMRTVSARGCSQPQWLKPGFAIVKPVRAVCSYAQASRERLERFMQMSLHGRRASKEARRAVESVVRGPVVRPIQSQRACLPFEPDGRCAVLAALKDGHLVHLARLCTLNLRAICHFESTDSSVQPLAPSGPGTC